jgi:hypothetical protein
MTSLSEDKINNLINAAIKLATDELKAKIKTLEDHIANINNQLVVERNKTIQPKPLFSDIAKKNIQLSETEKNYLNAVNTESQSQSKKEKNIIIFGLNETGNIETDKLSVINLFKSIDLNESSIVNTKRFSKGVNQNDKPGLILVELKSKSDVQLAISANKKVRENNIYKNLFINQDFTVAQRAQYKKLRDERTDLNKNLPKNNNEYWGIRNFMLIKIKKKNNTINSTIGSNNE